MFLLKKQVSLFLTSFFLIQGCGFVEVESDGEKSPAKRETKLTDKVCKNKHSELHGFKFKVTDKGRFCIGLRWIKGPLVGDFSVVEMDLRNIDLTAPEKISAISVMPWMKIHGHGTGDVQPNLKRNKKIKNRFEVSNIFFIMDGPWELNIAAEINGKIDKVEYPVAVED